MLHHVSVLLRSNAQAESDAIESVLVSIKWVLFCFCYRHKKTVISESICGEELLATSKYLEPIDKYNFYTLKVVKTNTVAATIVSSFIQIELEEIC